MLRGFVLVVERCIFFLQVPGIRQQNAAEVNGCWRGVNRPAEALLDQARDPSTVIEMSVGQNQGFDVFGGEREIMPVAFPPFLLALKEAAVD